MFDYSTQELNTLLDLVQKGQILYTDFLPIESTSFINSLKLVGDNPYLIEQSINDDFDVYSKQLEQIKLLLEANRSEYISLRKSELKNQIASIDNRIENAIVKENELSGLVSIAKDDFDNLRNIEFTQQLESITQILSQIDTIFSNNKNNPDLTNSDKVNGFGYKVLSVFPKARNKLLLTTLNYKATLTNLKSV